MRAEIAAAVIVVIAAVATVRQLESAPDEPGRPSAQAAAVDARASAAALAGRADAAPYSAGWGEEVRIPASRDHQYYVTAAVNDWPASFLVDTGASFVALRDSDARRAGVYTSWADFDFPVRTANGETNAARVMLKTIEINGIRVENVQAFILQDDQLSINLLGMSFLSRLDSIEARGGELVLRG